jgi:hypothetical protein
MPEVNIHEAKTQLVPAEPKPRRVLGQDEGVFEVPDDFDASLPADLQAYFES